MSTDRALLTVGSRDGQDVSNSTEPDTKPLSLRLTSQEMLTLVLFGLVSIVNGFDFDGRPIIYMRPGRENTQKSPRQIEHLIFHLSVRPSSLVPKRVLIPPR